jgi:hypothetical protein
MYDQFYQAVTEETKGLTDPPALPIGIGEFPNVSMMELRNISFKQSRIIFVSSTLRFWTWLEVNSSGYSIKKTMSVVQEIENLVLDAANGEAVSIPKLIADP